MGEVQAVSSPRGPLPDSGRYTVYGEIASGGMATVQYGRLLGAGGFTRNVAIKRLHPHFARDADFVAMFLDEARLAARITHANVVPTLDVLSENGELAVVMEYVHGETLARLIARADAKGEFISPRIAAALISGVLHGLHAAHETRNEQGEALDIIHRDVSPQNVLVGSDGIARVLDFGIAKARDKSRLTPTGELKGKLAYMAPEQYRAEPLDRRVDVYGAAVVLWEVLTARPLFDGPSQAAIAHAVLHQSITPPSQVVPNIPEALDRIVMRGLARDKDERFATAREMALALEREVGTATQTEVVEWLEGLASDLLEKRAQKLKELTTSDEPKNLSPLDPAEAFTQRLEPGWAEAQRAARTLEPAVEMRATTGTSHRPVKRSLEPWHALVLAGLTVVTTWAALETWRAPESAEEPTTPPLNAAPQAATSAASAPSPAAVSPPATKPSAPPPAIMPSSVMTEETPDSDASANESLDAPTPAKPKASRPRRKESNAPPAESVPADCKRKPYFVDELGIRRVRRECL